MNIEYLEPASLEEACLLLQKHGGDSRVIAGGTSVVLMLRQQLISPRALVSLGGIPDLDYIRRDPDGVHLGALASLRAIERSTLVRATIPALAQACGSVGNIRVRNQATLGGNLSAADYAADPPAMLAALDARVRLVSAAGERELPLEDFFSGFYTTVLEPGELLAEVIVPRQAEGGRAVYLKVPGLSAEGRPCVAVGVLADLDEAGNCQRLQVAIGAAVEVPRRLPAVEAWAAGRSLTDELVEAIAEAYSAQLEPLSDVRGSAWYRGEMIRVFVRRALVEARDGRR